MRQRARALLFAAALALSALAAHGEDASNDPAAAYRAARGEIVARLEALAVWCAENRCAAERERALESIVAVDTDNAAARRALRHKKGKDGKWQVPPEGRPPLDEPAHAAEAKSRREEAVNGYRTAALDFASATNSAEQRERAIDELIAVDPDGADGRAANRETLVDGRWLLDETVSTKERAIRVAGAIAAARKAGAAPAESIPSSDESVIAKWIEVRTSDHARALAADGVTDVDSVVRNVDIVRAAYPLMTGQEAPPVPGLRFYLFANPEAGFAAIERDARLKPEDRTWARSLRSYWVPDSADLYVWPAESPVRLEWGVRQTVSKYMHQQFGVGAKPGWTSEGTCHLFSEAILGTHLCWFVRPSEYADPSKGDAMSKRTYTASGDWMVEGRELEKSAQWPDLRIVLGRELNAMTAEDTVVSYLLCRFLALGRPSDAAGVLLAIGKKSAPDAWVNQQLGITVEGLERRLRRWVREMK